MVNIKVEKERTTEQEEKPFFQSVVFQTEGIEFSRGHIKRDPATSSQDHFCSGYLRTRWHQRTKVAHAASMESPLLPD